MSDPEPGPHASPPRDGSRSTGEPREPGAPHPASSLRFVAVEYADRPDRCTIHPPEARGPTLMSTWLTADREDFVDLAEYR